MDDRKWLGSKVLELSYILKFQNTSEFHDFKIDKILSCEIYLQQKWFF